MANILLLNSLWRPTYKNILSYFGLPFFSVLCLAIMVAQARKSSHRVVILVLSFRDFIQVLVLSSVKKNTYNIVSFKGTTLLFLKIIQLLKEIKKINRDISTIGGFPLCPPERYIDEAGFDLIRLNLRGSNCNNRLIC